MALQAVKHGFPFPVWPVSGSASTPGGANLLLDADTERAAAIFTASAAKAIHKIHFRTSTVTTGATVDCRVETVDSATDGNPTGTLWGTNTNGSVAVANGDDGVWKTVTLTADTAALAIGDVFALVIANGTGGNLNIRGYSSDNGAGFPHAALFTASWAKTIGAPMIIPEYSDGSFEPVFGRFDYAEPLTATSFASDSATNRRGNIFQLAFPSRAKGCWVWVDADGPFTVKLYDSDGTTVLATTATANAVQRQSDSAHIQFYPFTSTALLSAGVNYRLAVVPTSTTALTVYDFEAASAGMLDMFPGGQACHRSVYTSGSWVETTTARSYLGVFLDAFDDGVSAGGGVPIIGGSIIRTVNRAA